MPLGRKKKMSSSPIISILIPVYNVEQYVEKCLVSLFNNTIISECEIIIVNDCSTDNSVEVIKNVLNKFPTIKEKVMLRSHDYNRGLAAARNTALLQAHGKYIICVDSDDWVEKDYLEKLYMAAQRTKADVVACNLYKCFLHKKTFTKAVLPKKGEDCLKELLQGKVPGWLHEKLIKRSILVDNSIQWVEGLDLYEDVLLCVKLFFFCNKISNVEEPLYYYRFNKSSLVNTFNEKRILNLQGIISEIQKFFIEQNYEIEYEPYIFEMELRIKCAILCESSIELQKKYFDIYPSITAKDIILYKNISILKRLISILVMKRRFFLGNTLIFWMKVIRKILYG